MNGALLIIQIGLGLGMLMTLGLMAYVAFNVAPGLREVNLAFHTALADIDDLADEIEAEELAREIEAVRRPTLAEQYQDDVNKRLAWNMANAHLYKQGDLAVISVSYDKTSKGKIRRETTVLGVVPKAEVTRLVIDVEATWAEFTNRLFENNKPAPSVTNIEFISFVPFIGWRRGEHIITDQDIEEKHGRTSIEKAFKQLKSL